MNDLQTNSKVFFQLPYIIHSNITLIIPDADCHNVTTCTGGQPDIMLVIIPAGSSVIPRRSGAASEAAKVSPIGQELLSTSTYVGHVCNELSTGGIDFVLVICGDVAHGVPAIRDGVAL